MKSRMANERLNVAKPVFMFRRGCLRLMKHHIAINSMRDSSPYKTIAVATTFSPRFKNVLAEAKRIRDRFGAELHLIHAGKRNQETPGKFSDVLAELELPADSPIHYEEGDPAEAILARAREGKYRYARGRCAGEGDRVTSVSGKCRTSPGARGQLFSDAVHASAKTPETAAPNCVYCRSLTAGIGGIENDADAGGSRIVRATVCDWNHHCV